MRAFILVINLVLASITATTPLQEMSPAPNSTMDYLERALGGLDKAFSFFQRVYRDVNLDAIIGTRITEGRKRATFETLLNVDRQL